MAPPEAHHASAPRTGKRRRVTPKRRNDESYDSASGGSDMEGDVAKPKASADAAMAGGPGGASGGAIALPCDRAMRPRHPPKLVVKDEDSATSGAVALSCDRAMRPRHIQENDDDEDSSALRVRAAEGCMAEVLRSVKAMEARDDYFERLRLEVEKRRLTFERERLAFEGKRREIPERTPPRKYVNKHGGGSRAQTSSSLSSQAASRASVPFLSITLTVSSRIGKLHMSLRASVRNHCIRVLAVSAAVFIRLGYVM